MNNLNHNCPVVSIVLPCYNAENVVTAAIESVVNSTIASSCELIIVNDGSEDSTMDVIDDICKQISNLDIHLINTKNQGVSKARNEALSVSKGKYIAFLDADDRISPCMFENMVAYSEERGGDFLYCGLTSDLTHLCKKATRPEYKSKDEFFSTLLYKSIQLRFSCVLYRREIIEKNSLRFEYLTF